MNKLTEMGDENLKENGIEIYNFENENVEILYLDGEPLFNPYHIGKLLEISGAAVRNHLKEMDDDMKIKLENPDVILNDIRKLNNRGEIFLKKPGLYWLMMKSRKPEADKFKLWIVKDVLPQIRKTGSYNLNPEQQGINQISMAVEKFFQIGSREIAILQNESPNKKLWNLILDCSTNGLGSPEFLYEELHYIFASETGIDIPEIAKLKGMKTRDYLRKNRELAQTLYEFAYRHFKVNNSRQIVLIPSDQSKLTEWKKWIKKVWNLFSVERIKKEDE